MGSTRVDVVPDVSVAAPVAGVALACLAVGAEAGLWLLLIGSGLLALAAALGARELARDRALRRRATGVRR